MFPSEQKALQLTRAPASFAARSTPSDCDHPARLSRTAPCSRSTVSMLCAYTSSPEPTMRCGSIGEMEGHCLNA